MAAQTQRNAWEWVIKLSCHTRHNAMQNHCSSVSKTDYINYTAQSADSIFRGMSQQAVALVTSRMWRLRHLTQVFHVLSIEVWNPTFWKNSKQPMLTSNHYAVKGIIGNGQSSSQVCQRGHCLSYLVFVIFGTPLHYWGQKVRSFATKYPKLAKTGQNWTQFLFLYAKNYASLKKVRLCRWWRWWLISAMLPLRL